MLESVWAMLADPRVANVSVSSVGIPMSVRRLAAAATGLRVQAGYLLLAGVNDGFEQAAELAVRPDPASFDVQILMWNAVPGLDTMRERTAVMDAHADAFLALPGGIGTCEEMCEAWTAGALDLHAKPVVLLDPDGFYKGLLGWVDGLAERGFVDPAAMARLVVCDGVGQALDACAAGRSPGS